jgi:hypothetical protein
MGLGRGRGGFFSGDDLEAVGDGGETHFFGDVLAQLHHEVGGEGDDFAGVEVEQVVVGVGGVDKIVVGLFSAAEEDLLDEAGVKEVLEGAVDGGFGDAVVGFAEGEEEFLGLEGTAELLDGFENGEAFRGVLQLALMEEVAENMLRGIHGGMMVAGGCSVNSVVR